LSSSELLSPALLLSSAVQVLSSPGGVEGGGGAVEETGEAATAAVGGRGGGGGVGGVGGGDCAPSSCGRLPGGGEAVAGEHSAFRFFMALVSLGVESTLVPFCCCGEATTAA